MVQKMPKNASKNSPVLYHGQRKVLFLGFAIFHTPSHTKGVWKIEKSQKKISSGRGKPAGNFLEANIGIFSTTKHVPP